MTDSHIQRPLDPGGEAIDKKRASSTKDKEGPSNVPLDSQIVPTPPHHKESTTTTCRPDQTPWWKHFLEVVALVVGLVVAIIYYLQLRAFNESTEESTETQIRVNMPLVGVTRTFTSLDIDTNQVRLHQTLTNLGETRAIGPIIELGWGSKVPIRTAEYQLVDHRWEHTTWFKGMTYEDSIGIPLGEAKRLAKLTTPLYICYRVRYEDAFPIYPKPGHARNDHVGESCLQIDDFDISDKDAKLSGHDVESGTCVDEMCPAEDYNYNK